MFLIFLFISIFNSSFEIVAPLKSKVSKNHVGDAGDAGGADGTTVTTSLLTLS